MITAQNNGNTKRFGFAQLRFFIAAVLLIAAGLKAYQLATAPLPPVIQGSMFTPLLELLNDRYLQMVVVLGEILFALVLISGLWQSWTWLLSLLGFSAFTLVSVMKGLSGEASCGCFGTVTVNPWITATFDAAIVGLLLLFRPPKSGAALALRLEHKKSLVVLIVWLVLAVPTLFFMLSLKEQPHATLGTEFTAPDGSRMILLKPEDWIGKEFPLFVRFAEPEGSEVLRQGTWNILIVQPDCEDCKEMMAELEEKKMAGIALVVVPSRPNDRIPDTSFPAFWLDRENSWFVSTPCVVTISDGICAKIGNQVEE